MSHRAIFSEFEDFLGIQELLNAPIQITKYVEDGAMASFCSSVIAATFAHDLRGFYTWVYSRLHVHSQRENDEPSMTLKKSKCGGELELVRVSAFVLGGQSCLAAVVVGGTREVASAWMGSRGHPII